MKRIAQIMVIVLLIAIVILQVLIARGVFSPQKEIQVCPVGAITIQNGKAVIDSIKCIGCRRCVDGFVVPQATHEPPLFQNVLPDSSTSSDKPLSLENKATSSSIPSDPLPVLDITKAAEVAEINADSLVFRVSPQDCISCRLCVMNCPVGAISMVNAKAVIDQEKCIDCGICVEGNGSDFAGCPTSAISKTPLSPSSRP